MIELMVTIAIVAILAAIGYPNYSDYVRRGNVQEAPGNLSNYRAQLEQRYQDHRTYDKGDSTCGIDPPVTTKNFQYSCTLADSGQSYSLAATGRTGTTVAGLAYKLNQRNAQSTTCTSCAWSFSGEPTYWVMRKP
ncbi:type IV pilin protein [Variovorax sp. 54]|uniref:type IV pilin protein n=1 Tax=Variovorax sp. 54 TaxID=2035212 RepID=UPI0035A066F9